MPRRTVVTVGLTLSMAACSPKQVPLEPGAEQARAEPELNTSPSLPTWDEVPSGHPEGATNPPIPELIVTAEGDCFKKWVSPMMPRKPGEVGDRVDTCEQNCGTAIQCPERARELLKP